MQIAPLLRIRVAFLLLAIAHVGSGSASFAQGSAGGTIGNDDKALSGTRERASPDVPRNGPVKTTRRSTPDARAAGAGCVLVKTQTTTAGCYGYVGYSKGVRVGWFRRNGMYIRSGRGEKCTDQFFSSTQIGPDSVRLADGTRIRLDAGCKNGQDF
jgi:hypothetical protein